MADRYWVGGTGTWDATTTTNWSASSGGAGGASAPTTADNVFFNSASNATLYTVTVTGTASCADMTMAGPASGNVTWAGAGALNVAGSMTVAATGITRTHNGTMTFVATTTGKTLTIGQTIGGAIIFNGVGGGWTLGSALTSTFTITLNAGTFDTSAASSYAVSCTQMLCASASTCVLNLNASTVTISSFSASTFTGAGLTLNAGTSQINFTSTASPSLSSSGRTFYNVAFTGSGASNTTATITGVNLFNNLSFASPSISTVQTAIFSANQTINGTLSASGATEIRRVFLRSDTLGTTRTLTLANPTTLSNVDIRDITAATNAITATSSGGNCGGNTNITFSTPKTVYWNLAGTQNWSATGWATSSGGTPAAANFPLAQDTAIFNNTGAAGTVNGGSFAVWNLGTIDMSARTSAMTLAFSSNPTGHYGSFFLGSGVTLTYSASITFVGRGNTQQIASNGATFPNGITVQNIGGTVQLTGAVTIASTVTSILTNGTLDLQSYTLTTGIFTSSSTNTRTLAFGTGNITVNGTGTVWNTGTLTNLTVTGTPVVNVSNNSATATTVSSGSPTEANSISFNFTTGTYALTHNAGSKRNLNFTGFAGTVSNTSQTIYGDLNLGSTATYTAGASGWIFASTSGTPRTITSNAKTMDFPLTFDGVGGSWVLQDALTMGSARTLTHANGTLDLNGKTLTVGTAYTTATGTKNLTFNGGTLVCPTASITAFNNAVPTGFTTTAGTGTGTISMTAATSKTFVGGGSTYNCTLNLGGAGGLSVTGSNTFNNITNTVQPTSFSCTGYTTTFNNFNLNGTAGNLVIVLGGTLSKASGTVSCDYLSISNSTATGGASWYAGANSFNGGSNTGWIFTAPPGGGVNVNVTGVFASGVVGTATVAAAANILTTGPPATGDVGTVTTTGVANVTLTGVSAIATIGDVGVSAGGSISVDVFGNAATGTVGTVATTGLANVTLTGVSATGSVGTATASIPTSVTLTGVSATGFVGTVTFALGASVRPTGVSAAGAVGTVRVSIPKSVTLTGVSATGAIGTSTVATAATLFPALFVNQNTFYSTTVDPGSVDIAPALFTNQNAFYAATALSTYPLTPALLQNVNQFFTASTYQYWSLLPGTIPSSNQFFSPVVYRGAPTPNWHREATAGDENFAGIDMIANPSWTLVPTSPTPNFTLDSQIAVPDWIQQ